MNILATGIECLNHSIEDLFAVQVQVQSCLFFCMFIFYISAHLNSMFENMESYPKMHFYCEFKVYNLVVTYYSLFGL